jgi:hypothetical protein
VERFTHWYPYGFHLVSRLRLAEAGLGAMSSMLQEGRVFRVKCQMIVRSDASGSMAGSVASCQYATQPQQTPLRPNSRTQKCPRVATNHDAQNERFSQLSPQMSADRDNDKKRARVEDESEVEVVRVRDSWKLPGSKSGKGKERELRRRPSIKNRNSSESPKKSTRRAEAADEDEGASTSTSRTLASAASSLHPGTPQSPPHDAVPNPENNEKDLEIERLRKELATKNEVRLS